MPCKFCGSNKEPDKIQSLESWGIIETIRCSKCFMVWKTNLINSDKYRNVFVPLKDLIAERKEKLNM